MKAISKFFKKYLHWFVVGGVTLLTILLLSFGHLSENGQYITFDGKDAQIPESVTEFVEDAKELFGMYVKQDSGEANEQLPQMGSFPYYKVDISTPTTFYNAVNGVGFNEGYGYQCVAAFKEFMYSLSGKVVATSTGGASGYAGQQSQIEPLGFTWHSGTAGLQNGDWGIFGGGTYGHVAMYYNGQWFGQNQGASDGNVGNAFNLANLGNSNVLGYYRPDIYERKEPTPTPEPFSPVDENGEYTYTYVKGDTFGAVLVYLGLDEGNLWGDNGTAKKYGKQLVEQNMLDTNGNVKIGVPFTLTR